MQASRLHRPNASMGYPTCLSAGGARFLDAEERDESVLLLMTACGCGRRGHGAAPAGRFRDSMRRSAVRELVYADPKILHDARQAVARGSDEVDAVGPS